jgi:hypothetical protein
MSRSAKRTDQRRATESVIKDGGLPLAQYITRCQHCTQIFRSSGIPIIGTTPEQLTAAFVNSVVQHIMKQHPEVMQACMVEQAKYGGLMVMSQFTSDDPELLKQKETARHAFFKQVQLVRISDAKIEERLRQLDSVHNHEHPISDEDGGPETWWVRVEDVARLMKEFRDVLEENVLDPPAPAAASVSDTPAEASKPS